MKPTLSSADISVVSITRQRCRVRIETEALDAMPPRRHASPGSDAGCGLKLGTGWLDGAILQHHPAAMPGAD